MNPYRQTAPAKSTVTTRDGGEVKVGSKVYIVLNDHIEGEGGPVQEETVIGIEKDKWFKGHCVLVTEDHWYDTVYKKHHQNWHAIVDGVCGTVYASRGKALLAELSVVDARRARIVEELRREEAALPPNHDYYKAR